MSKILSRINFNSITVIQTFERWITYYPFWGKVGFTFTGVVPNETITTACCESYFKDQKHSIHTTKKFKADFIEEHALIVANMVDRALLNGLKSKKPQQTKSKNKESIVRARKSQMEKSGSLEFSTAKWKRRTGNSKISYKTKIQLSQQPDEATTSKLIESTQRFMKESESSRRTTSSNHLNGRQLRSQSNLTKTSGQTKKIEAQVVDLTQTEGERIRRNSFQT